MSTLEAAMAAKADGQVLTGPMLDDLIKRSAAETGRSGVGALDTNPQRQRQVGLG